MEDTINDKKKWQPSVSLVMCTYNGEQFLKEQIDSILAQTYPLTEFLIFDDGSTDRTFEILTEYAQRHTIIRLHKNPVNLGYNLNFQQGLEAAQCEVIAIADQDDVWHHQKIEKMIDQWNPQMPVIHCDSQRFEEELPTYNKYRHLYERFEGGETRKLFIVNTVSGHAMMLRRSFLPQILPLEKNVFYDWWAAIVATLNGGVDFVDEVLVYQRVHHKNITVQQSGTTKRDYVFYRQLISTQLRKFLTLKELKSDDRLFGETAYTFMTELDSKWKRWQFFFFVLKHRRIFFYHKRRKVGIFSHLKYSFRWAFD